MSLRAAIALVSLFSSPARAGADEAIAQPNSKWVAEFADNRCLLSRSYGTDANPLVLSFEQFPTDMGITLLVNFRGKSRYLNYGDATARFGDSPKLDSKFGAYATTGGLRRVHLWVKDDSYRAATTVEQVSISVPGEITKTFAVPGFDGALDVLRKCVVDLGEHWGISASEQMRIATPAKSLKPLGAYFGPDDYPIDALKKDQMGQSRVRITVDESGRPQDCVVIKPSGVSSLDRKTCGVLLSRARFEPAKDVDGRAIKSVIVQAVNWFLM